MITKILALLRREGVLWGSACLFGRSGSVIASAVRTRLLGWPTGYLGKSPKISGVKRITIGKNFFILDHAWIECVTDYRGQQFSPQISIGPGFCASDNLHISAIHNIQVGANCLFGSGVFIGDHSHGVYTGGSQSVPFSEPALRTLHGQTRGVTIGHNCWFGDNVKVTGGVTIGNGTVVGANSVVTRDLPDNCVAVGSPAMPIKLFDSISGEWILVRR